ncbi:MAG TPA: hypothetical protein VFO16_02625 [Pseudonocardiaceae bacterium]|nr:hypothetical protein [Pseudonocardiaceae bacterium]
MRVPERRGPRPIGITDATTRVEHLMTDAMAAEHRHTGRYPALCGADVLAASLTDPGIGQCRHCREHVS